MNNTPEALVLDIGSTTCYLGYAGDKSPRSYFPNIIGSPKLTPAMIGMGGRFSYIGDEVSGRSGILKIRNPIEHGVIRNIEDMKEVWEHGFYNELRAMPEEHPILLTENAFNTRRNREMTIEVMFEILNIPALFIESKEILSVYSSGRNTAMILQSGGGVTTTLPLNNGYVFSHAVDRVNFGGEEITNYLKKLMTLNDFLFETTADHLFANDLKEKQCYVAVDANEELLKSTTSNSLKRTYTLPDGSSVKINHERFQCTEALFDPSLIGLECCGIHEMIYNSIIKCDCGVRRDFYGNIVIAGGNTMFNGLTERLEYEINKLIPKTMKLKIIASPERKYASWIGGSILASLSTFQNQWITKEEYDEIGPYGVHFKLPYLLK